MAAGETGRDLIRAIGLPRLSLLASPFGEMEGRSATRYRAVSGRSVRLDPPSPAHIFRKRRHAPYQHSPPISATPHAKSAPAGPHRAFWCDVPETWECRPSALSVSDHRCAVGLAAVIVEGRVCRAVGPSSVAADGFGVSLSPRKRRRCLRPFSEWPVICP